MPEEMTPTEHMIHAIKLQARAELAAEILRKINGVNDPRRALSGVAGICSLAEIEHDRLIEAATPGREHDRSEYEGSWTQGGPWTTHGHSIPGVTVDGPGRPPVYRCGGPGLCETCSAEAFTMRKRAGLER